MYSVDGISMAILVSEVPFSSRTERIPLKYQSHPRIVEAKLDLDRFPTESDPEDSNEDSNKKERFNGKGYSFGSLVS